MEKNELEIKHSKLNMASYGSGSLAREFINMAFTASVFYYYESAIGLEGWIVTLGYILFAIYNMFNDPLIGYITNRPFKFTKKWGRRFPWLMLGGIPWGFSYMMIYMPPVSDPVSGAWILFAWLLFTTCLFDTFHSIFFTSFMALFTEKYRSVKERRTASAIYIPIGVIGVALGAILPPLFIKFIDEAPKNVVLDSYVIQGYWVVLIGLIAIFLAIPGLRDDKETTDRYLSTYKKNTEGESFFKSLKTALKQKSFITYMFIYTMYQAQITTMQNSIYYEVDYVLDMPATAATLIFAGFLIGTVIATPFWLKYSRKVNDNKKVMMTAAVLLGIFTIPFLFLRIYIGIVILMIIWGTALGGFWFMIFPVMSDVIDESVVITGKREEGIYTGFSQFFGRLGIVAQAITFGLVHFFTGFAEGQASQTEFAIFGIQLHLGLIPAIFIFIGVLVFWKYYKLTPEQVKANQEKIKEMGL